MFLYAFLLCIVYDFLCYKRHKNSNYAILLVIFILIAGFRYRMAPDTVAYLTDYGRFIKPLQEVSLDYFQNPRYQPFWLLLNSIFKTFSNDFVYVQITCSFILHYSIFTFFKKTCDKFFTCILFYLIVDYVYFSMEIMRESLAISMFLFSILFYNEKKWKYSFIFYLFAVLFHSFAIFLLPIYLFLSQRLVQRFFPYFLVIFSIILFSLKDPMSFLIQILSSSFSSKLELYKEVQIGKINITGYLYSFVRILVVIMGIYMYKSKKNTILHLDKKLLNQLGFIYIFIVIIRVFSIPFMERFTNYFICFVILLTIQLFYNFMKYFCIPKTRFVFFNFIVLFLLFWNIYPLLKYDDFLKSYFYKRYFPYYSVFSGKVDPDREFMIKREAKE